ncbi:MAG: Ig-like domain-containing protein, partial [Thermoplasmata archaeon]|nr:Ig-like domain-containing protein [Thermoplasmata archaeon]
QDLSGQKPDQYWWDFAVTSTLTTATATGPTGTSNIAPITITYTTGGGPANAALYYTTNTAAPYTWNLIGSDTPADGSYGWTIPADGRYGWFAVAPDESAPTSVSVPEASTYVYDSTPPTSNVDLISPELYNTGPLGITATANDALSGVDYVELWYSFDGSLYGLFGTDNDGAPYDWSFNWPDSEGYYEFYTIAVDNAGNAETLPLTPDEDATYDTTSPVIITTDPVHLDVDVSINLPIIITFDESVDPTFWKFTCSPDPGGWAEVWNATKEQVTLTHASFVLNQGYTITVIWANDTVGNALAAGPVPNPWTFTTELVDNQPPIVESVSPTGSTVPVSSNIMITFNESMNTTSVESSIQIDPAVAYTVSWSADNRTITINPNIDFQYNKTYNFTVNDTAKDMNDNPMTSHYTWSFTTTVPPLVDIIPPVSSITGLDAYQNSLAFDIDWTSYDPSGIKMVELYYTTDGGTSWTKYGTNFTASQISFTASGEGVYGFYIVATDDSTNQNRETEPASGDSPMASTHVDITAPIVGVGLDVGSNSVITIDATTSDSGSGISSYLWTMVSGPGIITFTTANSEDTNIIADTDGTYVVRLTVIDNAGNTAYDEFQLVWDATRPTATISPDGSSTSVDSNITVTFSEPVNITMAESAFSISPVVTGTFIWNAAGTVMTYVPVSNLNYGTDYEVTIDSALIADNLGNQMLNNLTGTFTTASAPAGTGSITGQILDENGNGVPGATVSLEGTGYTTTTDSDGNFNLTDIPVGDHRLVIEKDGYNSQEMPVTVVSDEETSLPPVNLTPAFDPTPDWMWIIILLIVIVVVVAAVGGTIVKRSKSRQRKAMEEKEELEEDIEHSSIEAAEVMSVASAPAAQVLASTPEPTPPPPEPESEGIETELCPSCGFEIEKGTACPFCSSEPGVEEIHAEPVEEPVVQEPVREKPPAPTPEPEPEASQPAMLDNQEKIARIEKAYKEGKITKEQYLNNLERFKK